MNESPTPDEILRDIEFEILQGALGQDDLGQAIQAARRFHNRSRHELLAMDSRQRGRKIAVRQFQINDMLLALLQEMTARTRRLQIELQRTAGLVPEVQPGIWRPGAETTPDPASDAAAGSPLDWAPALASHPPGEARGDHALQVEAQIRPVRLPLVGRLLTRLRTALHSLPVFYVQQLAGQQREVNRILGESMAELGQVLAEQEAQVQVLNQQLQALQAQSDSDRRSEPR